MAQIIDYHFQCNKRQRRDYHRNTCRQFHVTKSQAHLFQQRSGPYFRTQFNSVSLQVSSVHQLRTLTREIYHSNVQTTHVAQQHAQVPACKEQHVPSRQHAQARVDVGELFQKLVASGLIPGATETSDSVNNVVQSQQKAVKRVKCSNCDLFLPKSEYSAHLQWHFDEKQRRKMDLKRQDLSRFGDNGVKALSVLEEKLQNETEGKQQVASVRCSPGRNSCVVCGEVFEQFFHEIEEEWHLKNAVCKNGFTVHLACADDLKNLLVFE
jgi:hypothetical protein